METTLLGRTSVRLPRLGLGAVVFGREIDERTSWELLDYALSKGINLIDTAEAYGGGNARASRQADYQIVDTREVSDEMHSSEKIIGRWMRARRCRDRVILCTKFNSGGRSAAVREALANSLARMQTGYVDIYMLHHPFPDVPIGETLEALASEVNLGRIRTIGCSRFSVAQLEEAQRTAAAAGLPRMESVQPALSLVEPLARTTLLPYCQQENIAVLSYSPLAAGFLSGKYAPGGAVLTGTRFHISPAHGDQYFNDHNFRLLGQLRELSATTGEPMTQLALGWVLHHRGLSSMLVGARVRGHIDAALYALEHPLAPAVIAQMNRWLGERDEPQGEESNAR